MNYRDEEDIFEEDIVFDQAGLLSSARKRGKSAIRRVSSGRCAMLSKTLALCGAFFGLGLSISLPGPATPMPPTDIDIENGGEEHIYRCLGFMLGSMLGGMLLDRFNRLFLVFLALLMCAVLVATIPWTGITWLLRSDLVLLGATMGFLLTGGNVLCLDLWGQNSGPFMQALHFSFSLGAFLAPLLATPLNQAVSTAPPLTEHQRFPRDINSTNLGYAEGMYISPMVSQNFTAVSAVPISSVAPLNTTNHLLLSSQTPIENSTSIVSNTSNQDNSSVSTSTTAMPHSTRHTPKPKPEKNIGKNLDKASKWERVHAGQPDPKDLAPITSTKATTVAQPSSSSQPAFSSNVSSTVELSNATTTTSKNILTSTTTKSPIQDIFQEKPIASKENGTSDILNDKVPAEKEEQQTVIDVNASIAVSPSNLSRPELSLGSSSTSAGPVSSSTSTSSTVITPSPSKSPQSKGTSSTMSSTSSTTELPSTPKSTTAAPSTPSTSTPTPSITSTSTAVGIIFSPEVPPKSLTLIEKIPSTSEPVVTLKTISGTPSPSPAVTPSTKMDHIGVPTTPRRHHSKPTSFDNDTEILHTVMDEVADHFGKEYGLSRLQLSYLLVALLLFVVSLLFLGFLCFNPRDPRSRSEDDMGGGRSNVVKPRWMRIMLTTLMMLVLAFSAGVQFTYGQLLVLFAMRSPLALSQSTGAALTATYWGAATSTRLACILVASALSPGALLVTSIALTAAATWLLSALAVQSAAALWVGAVLVAVSTASILPSSFLWMQQHIHVSHHVAGMLVMGPAMGEMLFPPLAMRIVKGVGDVAGLLHLPALLSLAVIALWAAAWRLARHPCRSLCTHADPAAYQLASQTDEDDLLDLTMSPVTHRENASVARRSASHANGNGVHRLNT